MVKAMVPDTTLTSFLAKCDRGLATSLDLLFRLEVKRYSPECCRQADLMHNTLAPVSWIPSLFDFRNQVALTFLAIQVLVGIVQNPV